MVPDLTGYTVREAQHMALDLNNWMVRADGKPIEDPDGYIIKGHTGSKPGDCLGTGEILGVVLDAIDTNRRSPFRLGILGGFVGGIAAAAVLWLIQRFVG